MAKIVDFYILGVIFVFICYLTADFHCALLDTGSENVPEIIKFALFNNYLFLTNWNYFMSHLLLIYALTDWFVLKKFFENAALRSRLGQIKDFLFVTVLCPGTVFVAAVFWALFFYDRELIYPRIIDDFIPFYLNVFIHFLIIIPVLLECFFKEILFVNTLYVFSANFAYCFIYSCVVFFWYVYHGRWVYIVLEESSWFMRVSFVLSLFVINTTVVLILYFFKGRKSGDKNSVLLA